MFPSPSSAASLSELRRAALQQLHALTGGERDTYSQLLTEHLTHWLSSQPAHGPIAAFLPLSSEPNILPLLQQLLSQQRTVLLPRLPLSPPADEPLQWVAFTSPQQLDSPRSSHLVRSPLGFLQPAPHLAPTTAIPQFLLVPGVLFGRNGERIGRGGGYYDRTLQQLRQSDTPPIAIAAAFEQQLRDSLPQQPHDQKVNIIASPKGLLFVQSPNSAGASP